MRNRLQGLLLSLDWNPTVLLLFATLRKVSKSERSRQGHVLFTVPRRPYDVWTTLLLLKDTNKSSVRAWLLGVMVKSLGGGIALIYF